MDAVARKRKNREKLKSDPEKLRIHLEKERERDKKRRQKKRTELLKNKKKLEASRLAIRTRVQRHRDKNKTRNALLESCQMSPLGTYKCKQTLRKAVCKVKKSLPESPTKQQVVVLELAKQTLPECVINKEQLVTAVKSSDSLSNEVIKKVMSFYNSDDISRQSPNRKDVVRVKNADAGETTTPKRHLVMTVSEVFMLFKEKHPEIKIQRTKFFELRPFHVRPTSETPHNVCVCIYHANFSFLLDSLKEILHSISTPSDLLKEICCDIDNENCMTERCTNCNQTCILDLVPLNSNLQVITKWNQWEKTSDGWLQIQEFTGSREELLKKIQDQIIKFKIHCFVKNSQAKFFEQKKLDSTEEEVVMQIDFAENFTIISQDEIQSAHWRHPQATLFTCCVWLRKSQKVVSYVVISNDLTHNKISAWLFLKTIIKDLKSQYPCVKRLMVFSDGCAAQFKNRFTISSTYYSEEVEWAFFATSHGKGAVDGLGATAKGRLWRAIKSRKSFINTAWECQEYLAANPKGVRYHFVSENDIHDLEDELMKRWENLKMLPQLQKQHYFSYSGGNYISYAVTGSSITKKCLLFKDKVAYEDVYSHSESEEIQDRENSTEKMISKKINPENNIEEVRETDGKIKKKKDMDETTTESSRKRIVESKDNKVKENTENNETESVKNNIKEKTKNKENSFGEKLLEENELAPECSGLSVQHYENGDFILVKFDIKRAQYRYVGIIDKIDNEDDEVTVTFLKTCDKSGCLFKVDDNDVSDVTFEQILKKLPVPNLVTKGNRIFYQFASPVDVFEK